MGQAKLKKKLGLPFPTTSGINYPEVAENAQIEAYLQQRIKLVGHFQRSGWQTWQYLALQHPELFPVQLHTFLDTCISRLLLPAPRSCLDLMMHSYYRVNEEHMFPDSQIIPDFGKEQSYKELKEKRWESLISSMSILLTRQLLNRHVTTIDGVRSQSLPVSSGGT